MKSFSVAVLSILALSLPALTLSEGGLQSGLAKGATVVPFFPKHVAGPDKGTKACPVCKYGYMPGVQVWINADNAGNTANLAKGLERELNVLGLKKVRAFVVFFNPQGKTPDEFGDWVGKLGAQLQLKKVALAYLQEPDDEAIKAYKINTDAQVRNTIFVYRNRKVTEKFVNFVADKPGLAKLAHAMVSVTRHG